MVKQQTGNGTLKAGSTWDGSRDLRHVVVIADPERMVDGPDGGPEYREEQQMVELTVYGR